MAWSPEIAMTLLGNLEKKGKNGVKWKVNMEVINESFEREIVGDIFDDDA